MDTILGVYLLISAILLLIGCGIMVGHGLAQKEPGIVGVGLVGWIIIFVLFNFSVSEYHEPKAIEVYQGKTTLEYTVKDGVKIDSVVVYKNKNYGSK